MRYLLLALGLCLGPCVRAQLITTDPAVPVVDQELTITFDATQGTGGLADCNCDIYLHTGVITDESTTPSDWKFIQTEWGVANDDWKLTPVEGESNTYTYTFGPSIRQYYGVPDARTIERVAFVFRNADGSQEAKADGGADIFVDVSAGNVLSLNVQGVPEQRTVAIGQDVPIQIGTTLDAAIEVFVDGNSVAIDSGTELATNIQFLNGGEQTVRVVATSGDETVEQEFTVTAALTIDLLQPTQAFSQRDANEVVPISATTYVEAFTTIARQNEALVTTTGPTLTYDAAVPGEGVATFTITSTYDAPNGETLTASQDVTFVAGAPVSATVPEGYDAGVSALPDGRLLFQLRAPAKSDVFLIGNFSDWQPTADRRMRKATNAEDTFFDIVDTSGLGGDILYQYLVDYDNAQPDPYSTLVLDPFNDPFIGEDLFPGLPDYPAAAEGIVSWYRTDAPDFNWENDDYERTPTEEMVIYELLVRDFLEDHAYTSLTDSLDYLERLGVTAIELMPVSEFEGNLSWGYNPSFHMALDKYYGTPEAFKTFVDAAHERGIAVLLDVVYNHAFGQSPLVRLYADENNRPTSDNPFVNVEARHPFNVGFDFNHESTVTQEYVKTTLAYWLDEYHVDGFRFDLSKGFTQNQSNTVEEWNRYDADRVAILKDYADFVWSVDDEAIMIMEHLGELREEEELATYGNGMYFWSGFGIHNQYLEAAMGYESDLREVLSSNRGFSGQNLVAYMESHDEERMMFKNLQFGNANGDYDVKDEETALDRVELASAFFYTTPGPKMLWQFGELGYAFSINQCPDGNIDGGCRTDNKPIRWDYLEDGDRRDLYNWIANLNYLRNTYDVFHDEPTETTLGTSVKTLVYSGGNDLEAVVVGNFDVSPRFIQSPFPNSGTWFDYRTNEAIEVAGQSLRLEPGEFHVYLNDRVVSQAGQLPTSTELVAAATLGFGVYPNPTAGPLTVELTLERRAETWVELLDATGRLVSVLYRGELGAGAQRLSLKTPAPASAPHFLRVTVGNQTAIRPLLLRK